MKFTAFKVNIKGDIF